MKRHLWFGLLISLLAFGAACDDRTGDDETAPAADDNPSTATDDDSSDEANNPLDPNPVGEALASGAPRLTPSGKACEKLAPTPWPAPDFADPSTISFDEQLFFTVDGQRFFPLGFYNAPTDAEGLQQFKDWGFNLALTGPGCCGSGTDPQVQFLELAKEKGVFIIAHPWSDPNDVINRPEEELAAELEARTGVGSLFGWYTFDEPALWRPSKELTERMHYILSTYAPNHPDCLVEQAMDNFSLYVDDCGFFMVDPYPVPHIFISMVKEAMIEAFEATEGLKPTVGVMQAFSWDWIYGDYEAAFRPTANEVRNMMWQFIVLGASGLIPWNYSGDYTIQAVPEIWDAFLGDIAEANELMRVLLADNSDIDLNVETYFPTMFDYLVKEEETATWVLSVSTNERPAWVFYDLSSIGTDLCVVDYTTNEVFAQDIDGRIEVRYDPLQVRILEILK